MMKWKRGRRREAKLYKALDKLEALIQHNEADISTWLPLEYDLQMTYGQEECEAFPYIRRLREIVTAGFGGEDRTVIKKSVIISG